MNSAEAPSYQILVTGASNESVLFRLDEGGTLRVTFVSDLGSAWSTLQGSAVDLFVDQDVPGWPPVKRSLLRIMLRFMRPKTLLAKPGSKAEVGPGPQAFTFFYDLLLATGDYKLLNSVRDLGGNGKKAPLSAFINQIERHRRSILVVDPNLTSRSPVMKRYLQAITILREKGFTFYGLCFKTSTLPDFPCKTFTQPKLPSAFQRVWFICRVALFLGLRKLLVGHLPSKHVQSTTVYFVWADINICNFLYPVWFAHLLQGKKFGLRALYGLTSTAIFALIQWLQFMFIKNKTVICNCDRLAEDVRSRLRHESNRVVVLPNAIDFDKFNPEERAQLRPGARDDLGIQDDEIVFAFASQGHYERKGLQETIVSLALTRQAGWPKLRLLIIGGDGEYQKAFQKKAIQWAGQDCSWIQWIPTVPNLEYYLSSSDAFIFLSHFETYALVSAEAAALGIPLFLTPYYGSEMYLEGGFNGEWCSHDPKENKEILVKALRRGLGKYEHWPGRTNTYPQFAAQLAKIYAGFVDPKDGRQT